MQNVDYEASVLSTCYVITPLMPHDFVLFFYLISYLCTFSFKYDFINSFLGNLHFFSVLVEITWDMTVNFVLAYLVVLLLLCPGT